LIDSLESRRLPVSPTDLNTLFQDIKERTDEDLLVLPTDAVLVEDPSFKVNKTELNS